MGSFSLHLVALLGIFTLIVKSEEVTKVPKCPGVYCGRVINETGDYGACGACPRGFRPDEASICRKCNDSPTFYDWLYLGFMAMLVPALHWFFIDFTNKRKVRSLMFLHGSALIESGVAGICTLLVTEPYGKLDVRSCGVKDLADWYTMMYNPRPGYTTTLHCTQEVVYPLYTMVMVYYAFCLVIMMLARPFMSAKLSYQGTKSIYAALYFFPILVVLQAIFGGVLYYFFPYIIIVVSVITIAGHFALYQEQSMKFLAVETFRRPRNLMIIISHWLLHAYGILSITQMKNPSFHGPLICLVPFPALFYVLTVKFTDPKQFT